MGQRKMPPFSKIYEKRGVVDAGVKVGRVEKSGRK